MIDDSDEHATIERRLAKLEHAAEQILPIIDRLDRLERITSKLSDEPMPEYSVDDKEPSSALPDRDEERMVPRFDDDAEPDILDRLRQNRVPGDDYSRRQLTSNAADEIERLRAELDKAWECKNKAQRERDELQARLRSIIFEAKGIS